MDSDCNRIELSVWCDWLWATFNIRTTCKRTIVLQGLPDSLRSDGRLRRGRQFALPRRDGGLRARRAMAVWRMVRTRAQAGGRACMHACAALYMFGRRVVRLRNGRRCVRHDAHGCCTLAHGNMHRETCHWQHTTCNLQCNTQDSEFKMQHASNVECTPTGHRRPDQRVCNSAAGSMRQCCSAPSVVMCRLSHWVGLVCRRMLQALSGQDGSVNSELSYAVQRATCDAQRMSCVVQRATYNGQHATCNLQHGCRQRLVGSRQGATSMQRTPHPHHTLQHCYVPLAMFSNVQHAPLHARLLFATSRVVYVSCHMSVALRCRGSVDDHNSSLPSVAHPQRTSFLASTHTPPTQPHRPRCAHACYLIALAALCQPSNDVPT